MGRFRYRLFSLSFGGHGDVSESAGLAWVPCTLPRAPAGDTAPRVTGGPGKEVIAVTKMSINVRGTRGSLGHPRARLQACDRSSSRRPSSSPDPSHVELPRSPPRQGRTLRMRVVHGMPPWIPAHSLSRRTPATRASTPMHFPRRRMPAWRPRRRRQRLTAGSARRTDDPSRRRGACVQESRALRAASARTTARTRAIVLERSLPRPVRSACRRIAEPFCVGRRSRAQATWTPLRLLPRRTPAWSPAHVRP
jgi:hypothetical protein